MLMIDEQIIELLENNKCSKESVNFAEDVKELESQLPEDYIVSMDVSSKDSSDIGVCTIGKFIDNKLYILECINEFDYTKEQMRDIVNKYYYSKKITNKI